MMDQRGIEKTRLGSFQLKTLSEVKGQLRALDMLTKGRTEGVFVLQPLPINNRDMKCRDGGEKETNVEKKADKMAVNIEQTPMESRRGGKKANHIGLLGQVLDDLL